MQGVCMCVCLREKSRGADEGGVHATSLQGHRLLRGRAPALQAFWKQQQLRAEPSELQLAQAVEASIPHSIT